MSDTPAKQYTSPTYIDFDTSEARAKMVTAIADALEAGLREQGVTIAPILKAIPTVSEETVFRPDAVARPSGVDPATKERIFAPPTRTAERPESMGRSDLLAEVREYRSLLTHLQRLWGTLGVQEGETLWTCARRVVSERDRGVAASTKALEGILRVPAGTAYGMPTGPKDSLENMANRAMLGWVQATEALHKVRAVLGIQADDSVSLVEAVKQIAARGKHPVSLSDLADEIERRAADRRGPGAAADAKVLRWASALTRRVAHGPRVAGTDDVLAALVPEMELHFDAAEVSALADRLSPAAPQPAQSAYALPAHLTWLRDQVFAPVPGRTAKESVERVLATLDRRGFFLHTRVAEMVRNTVPPGQVAWRTPAGNTFTVEAITGAVERCDMLGEKFIEALFGAAIRVLAGGQVGHTQATDPKPGDRLWQHISSVVEEVTGHRLVDAEATGPDQRAKEEPVFRLDAVAREALDPLTKARVFEAPFSNRTSPGRMTVENLRAEVNEHRNSLCALKTLWGILGVQPGETLLTAGRRVVSERDSLRAKVEREATVETPVLDSLREILTVREGSEICDAGYGATSPSHVPYVKKLAERAMTCWGREAKAMSAVRNELDLDVTAPPERVAEKVALLVRELAAIRKVVTPPAGETLLGAVTVLAEDVAQARAHFKAEDGEALVTDTVLVGKRGSSGRSLWCMLRVVSGEWTAQFYSTRGGAGARAIGELHVRGSLSSLVCSLVSEGVEITSIDQALPHLVQMDNARRAGLTLADCDLGELDCRVPETP